MKRDIVIFGAGGHARVVLDLVRVLGAYTVVAVVERERSSARTFGQVPIVSEAALRELGTWAGIIAVGDNEIRQKIALRLREEYPPFEFVSAVHPRATVAADVQIGLGTTVMAGSVVNSGTVIGDHVIVNTGATVDHDCSLANFSCINPGATLGGGVSIRESAFIGIGATVLHQISVGARTTVGAGAVVTKDVPQEVVSYGVPAQIVRKR